MPKRPQFPAGAPDRQFFGAPEAGNLPWKSRQLHELSERARQELGDYAYEPLPSGIAERNRLQNLVSSQIEHLFKKKDLENLQKYEFAQAKKAAAPKNPLELSPEALAGYIMNVFDRIDPATITNEMLRQAGLNPVIGHFQLEKVRHAYARGMEHPVEPPAPPPGAPRRPFVDVLNETRAARGMPPIGLPAQQAAAAAAAPEQHRPNPFLPAPQQGRIPVPRAHPDIAQRPGAQPLAEAFPPPPRGRNFADQMADVAARRAQHEPIERKEPERKEAEDEAPPRGRRASMPELEDIHQAEADEDTFDLARKEISKSLDKRQVHKILQDVDTVNDPFDHADNKYIMDEFDKKYKAMSDAIQEETAENYRRNIAPHLNYQYMQGGKWNSAARGSHQDRVITELNKDMTRKLASMRAQGFEKALGEIHQHKQRRLDSAHLAGQFMFKEKEHANVAAKNLAENDKASLLDKVARIDVARQAGNEQQIHEQAKKAETRLEALQRKEFPLEMLEREVAMANAMPAPAHLQAQRLMEDTRPNYAQLGASGIGSVAMANLLQPRHKKGGMVGYAPGGFVLPNIPKSPEDLHHEQFAHEMQNKNSLGDPAMYAIAQMGASMAKNYGRNPINAYGQAMQEGLGTLASHRGAHQQQRERGIALMQKIQQSRLKQQSVIADFEHQNKVFDAAQSHRGAALAETRRHHGAMEGNALSKAERKANAEREVIIGGKTLRSQQKLGLSPQDQMQARKNDEALTKLESREAPYDETLQFLESNTPSTGWIAEHTPDISDKARQYQRNLSSMVSSVVAPGVMTKAKLDFAKQQKPSQMDSPTAVKEFAAKGKKVIEEDKEPLMLAQQYRTYGIPDRITLGAYKEWVKNEKEGDFDDYLKAILEGGEIPQHEKSSSKAAPTRQDAQAELKRRGLI